MKPALFSVLCEIKEKTGKSFTPFNFALAHRYSLLLCVSLSLSLFPFNSDLTSFMQKKTQTWCCLNFFHIYLHTRFLLCALTRVLFVLARFYRQSSGILKACCD